MPMTIYECPECEERTLVSHSKNSIPTLYCNCGDFVVMDKVDE